jgi:hypothetical protein
MYFLAVAFLVASAYSFWVGDSSNAKLVLGVALVLACSRFFLGPQEEASPIRKIGLGVGILILIAAVTYAIHSVFV